ncbi:MAG: DEAD/DEAH box helicase [Proteobacteria bacterium]|nr:DEAD/DEAH box helicase [Pseudomonadota bacterium]MBI3496563.1 DEAD/DEAH box helicase [Pseudomonadota bacterium]
MAYQASRKKFGVAVHSSAEQRLKLANLRHDAYEATLAAQPLDVGEMLRRLQGAGFIRDLTNEQKRNVTRLATRPSAATFSVPGAGKTTEALAVYALKRIETTRLFVVAPKNAFAAWEEQLGLCLRDSEPFVRLTGGRATIRQILRTEPSKTLITYQQLPNVLAEIGDFLSGSDSILFLDESHRIKRGLSGVIGNAILSISDIPSYKLIMSGTPMPNDLADLVPQFRFLFPEINADENTVTNMIQPVYVRTTKAELNLPAVERRLIPVPLKPAQHELYRLLSSEAAREAEGLHIADRMKLRRIGRSALRLLQVVSNPGLLARAVEFEHTDLLAEVLEEGDSAKLEAVCLRARQLALKGQKTIIWSSFVDNVEIVAQRLIDLGADYIHGGVDAGSEDEEGTREQKIKRFHDDANCYVLVANPAACGEGISLHSVCHHAIYLDRNYNAAQFLQSEDRIHRLGLRPDQITTVEMLICLNTVDESVNRRLITKIGRMAEVLQDPGLRIEPVSVDLDADVDAFDDEDLADFVNHLNAWRR